MNLIEAILLECDRVRDLIPSYEQCDTGFLAVYLMREAIKRATRAIADNDGVECALVYQCLQGFKD
jgi:hypothetical protein